MIKLIIVSDCFGMSHRCECININGTTIPTPLNAEKLLPPRVYLCWFDGLLLDVQIICCVSRNVIFGVHHSCILCFTPGPSAWNYIFLMLNNMICAETFGRIYCFLDHDCQYCYQHWFKVFSNWHMCWFHLSDLRIDLNMFFLSGVRSHVIVACAVTESVWINHVAIRFQLSNVGTFRCLLININARDRLCVF